jgi:hypothetical protein
MPQPTSTHALTSEFYELDIAGVPAGLPDSFDGGDAVGPVVIEKLGPDFIIHKHIAGVTYEEITLTCGADMSQDFFANLKSVLNRKFSTKNFAVKTLDANLKAGSQMNIFNAFISQIGFPALDGASKGVAKLTIKITPEYTRMQTATGSPRLATPSKRWLASNFRLSIARLDCTHVKQIDAFTATVVGSSSNVGEQRDYQSPSHLELSNLVVTLPESHCQSFRDWHDDFVVKGNNGQTQERTGTLDFLSEDLKSTLFSINFGGLGIFRLTRLHPESGQNVFVRAEMYCETVDLVPPTAGKG